MLSDIMLNAVILGGSLMSVIMQIAIEPIKYF